MASVYTREQIDQFLHHIQLPEDLHHAPPSPELLRELHVHMLSAVPYDNLSIHYSPAHTVDIDPQSVFRKIVLDGRGRGGYCMENALLYNHMLRGLGFDSYTAGVRTRPRTSGVPQGDFPGWIHVVSIVSFPDGTKYHADVSFGGDGATFPLPLVDGLVHRNIGSQQIRLVRDWIPTQTHRVEASKLWIYQYRNSSDAPWNSFYCFPELEFMQLDFELSNWFTAHNPKSHQTSNVLLIRFLRRAAPGGEGDEGGGESASKTKSGSEGGRRQEIYGKRMLVNGTVKENLGGKTSVIAECATEDQRVAALQQHFGITLTREEKEGIRGWASELSG